MEVVDLASDGLSWASSADYKYNDITELFGEKIVFPSYYRSDIPAIVSAERIIEQHHSLSTYEIYAEDLRILAWNWIPNSKYDRNYKYFILSRTNSLLCDDIASDSTWLKYFGIFSNLDSNHVNLKIADNVSRVRFDDKVYQIALGGSHFGHWVADTVPKLLLNSERNPNLPQIFTRLTDLESKFIGRLSKNSVSGIAIDLHGASLVQFSIPKALITVNFGLKRRHHFTQANIARSYSIEHGFSKKKGCYLVRGHVDGHRRLENEDEIILASTRQGLDIISPLNHPFFDLPKIFQEYSHFVYFNSSVNTNFNLLASKFAKALAIVPTTYSVPTKELVLGAAAYQIPRLDSTKICMLARSVSSGSHEQYLVDIAGYESELKSFLGN